MVCSRITIIAASTTGSTAACGMEPCAPRPCTVMRMLSAAESAAPARVPTRPARNRMLVDVPEQILLPRRGAVQGGENG
jgi:hypothetical protein